MDKPVGISERRTPLYASQKSLGAEFDTFFGWEMAGAYAGSALEQRAVKNGVGLIDLSSHGAIVVPGKESVQFLNGLGTNHAKARVAGHAMRAAFLTEPAKV